MDSKTRVRETGKVVTEIGDPKARAVIMAKEVQGLRLTLNNRK